MERVLERNLQAAGLPNKPLNKKITFSYGDDEEDDDEDDGEEEGQEEVIKSDTSRENDASRESQTNKDANHHNSVNVSHNKVTEETNDFEKDGGNIENVADNSEKTPTKKRCPETDTSKRETNEKEKSIDKLIEAELTELGDKSKDLPLIPSLVFEESVNIMEGSSGSSYNHPAKPASELETLQKEHEEKTLKIQELKSQIEGVKLRLEKKKKKEDRPDERKEAFNNLSEKYNSLREEYNALLGENRSREQN